MIVITGSLAYDYIMDFPGSFSDHILPDQIHNINLSFLVNKFAKRRGGTAGNVSYSLGLLQVPHILFSVAGNDFSEYAKAFKKLKIATEHVLLNKSISTATGFAMTDQNNNQIWGFFPGATTDSTKLKLETVATEQDFVLIGPQGAEGSMHLVHQCVTLNIPYLFDPGFTLTQISDNDLLYGVTHATMLIGNDYEIKLIQSRISQYSKICKDKIIITTLGENGAIITSPEKEVTIKPAKATAVVDPTGAGDAWRSGFLAGFANGFDLQTCGQLGSIASVYAVEKYGTQEHKYTKRQFTKRYKETYNKDLRI